MLANQFFFFQVIFKILGKPINRCGIQGSGIQNKAHPEGFVGTAIAHSSFGKAELFYIYVLAKTSPYFSSYSSFLWNVVTLLNPSCEVEHREIK